MRRRAALLSMVIHGCAVLALLFLAIHPSPPPRTLPFRVERLELPRWRPEKTEGGGGARQQLPAQRGRAPVAVTRRVFVVPPQLAEPKLVVDSGILEAPAFNLAVMQIGDPGGAGKMPSGGPGGPFGIGGGGPGGIGDRDGVGVGSRTHVTRGPVVLYQPEPEYSDEARKAHFQGTVILSIEIDSMGRPSMIHIVRGLGLGLDEKAIEAVERWRFRPAYSGDQPIAVQAQVEVSFHLL